MKHRKSRRIGSSLLIGMLLDLLIACMSPCVIVATVRNHVSYEDTETRARELWEKAVAAKGGRERLRKISSLYVVRVQPRGDRSYGFYVFPDYSFDYSYWSYRESTAIEVYNHNRAVTWGLLPRRKVGTPRLRDNDDPSTNIIAQFLYLMVTNWMDPKPLRTRKDWIGLKHVDVVEVDANGWRVDYYLDPKTFLPIQVDRPTV